MKKEKILKKLYVIPIAASILFTSATAAENKQTGTNSESISHEEVELDKITVTGTRKEIKISKYPGSISKLEKKDFLESSNLIEDISNIPGFETGGSLGRSIANQFTIRGFGFQSESRVIIKQDGIRRSPGLYSNMVSSFRSDPDILKSVEVVKGASSISHGGGAIGGVVGMTTRDPKDFIKPGKTFGVELRARYESNNHRSAGTAIAGRTEDGKFDFVAYAKKIHNGDITNADEDLSNSFFNEDSYSTFLKGGFEPTDTQRIELSYFQLNQDLDTVWQSNYNLDHPSKGPVEGILSQKDIVLNYEFNPNSELIDLEASAFRSEASYDRTYDIIEYENIDESWGGNFKNKSILRSKLFRQEILTGLDYNYRTEDATYVRGGILNDFGSMPNKYKDLGLFIQDEFYMFDDRLMVLIGGRYDRFDRSVKQGQMEYDESNFSPRIGTAFEVYEGLTLLANYSESFRAPTPAETSSNGPINIRYWYLPNPDLDPEKAKEYELGFSYINDDIMGSGTGIFFKAMYFNGVIEDMISLDPLPELGESPDGTPYAKYKNVDEAKRNGYEIETKIIYEGLTVNATYEHLDQYDSKTDEKVPNAFADKLMLGASYTFDSIGLTLSGKIRHWFEPDQNPEYIEFRGKKYYLIKDEFTICDISASWKPANSGIDLLDNSFELTMGMNNIFDDKYINARGFEDSHISGKGKNFYVSIVQRF